MVFAAPATAWQHCLDESSQCYYYWNVETNEVTWEIPAAYSQYLLQYKEYEDDLEKFNKMVADGAVPRPRSLHLLIVTMT